MLCQRMVSKWDPNMIYLEFFQERQPLTLLTQKNKAYVWGDKQDEAFQILKEKLCNAPVLALPDGPDDFVVYCDASKQVTQELSCVHDTFHVSNLKKCLAESDVQVPLDEIEIDENLRFCCRKPIRVLVGIMEVTDQAKEIKHLKAQIKKLKKKAKLVITHHRAWDEECILEAKIGKKEILEVANEEKETVDDEVSTKDAISTAQQKEEGLLPTITTPINVGDDEQLLSSSQHESHAKAVFEVEKKFSKNYARIEEMARKSNILHSACILKADRLLAISLQDEERELFTVEERAQSSFMDYNFISKESFLLTKKLLQIRNKLLLRTQLRNQDDDLFEALKRFDESFTAVGSTEDERRIKEMNKGVKDPDQKENLKKRDDQQDWKIVTWRLYEACGVCILEFEDGTVIHMLVERRYPLSKDLLQRMLDLGLEVERESTVALDLHQRIYKAPD
ncbi:putative reverse transcriptase domain-containing protein [Tanacetum coccineum]